MELGKESKMVGMALTVLLVFVSCGPATSQDLSPEVLADQDIQDLSPEVLADQDIQDLSPEVLADQYMVEGVDALEHGEGRRAIEAFEKIEVLEVEPPAMFPFFYGKALVEKGGAEPGDLLKGQALLKRFVINTERGSEHSNAALQLLAGLERKRQSAQWTSQLFTAVRRGQPEEVQALIDAGADVNARDNDADNAYTPLHVAAKKGHAEVAQVLIDAGGEVDATAGAQAETPLHVAAWKGHAEVARVLVDAGAAVDARQKDNYTPLYRAAGAGHAEVVRVLIGAGAAVNARVGQYIYTPLHVAASAGHAEVVRVLIAAGADAKGRYGNALLHKAIDEGHAEIAQGLIAAGADVNAPAPGDFFGWTPLHAVSSTHNYNCATIEVIVQALIDAGANVNTKNLYGGTPLGNALGRGCNNVVRILKAAGAVQR